MAAMFHCILLLLVTIFGASHGQDINFSAMEAKLFTANCTDDQYTGWATKCIWPHGDLRRVIDGFLGSARDQSCKVPPRTMVRSAFDKLKDAKYVDHPLYSLIPPTPCGFCARKVKCCTQSRSFMMQSYKSDACDQRGAQQFCVLPKIDQELKQKLSLKYPNVTYNGNECDFDQYFSHDMKKIQKFKAFGAFKPLLCQLYGTAAPNVNCVSVENQCRCCCLHYTYQNGQCVPVEEKKATNKC